MTEHDTTQQHDQDALGHAILAADGTADARAAILAAYRADQRSLVSYLDQSFSDFAKTMVAEFRALAAERRRDMAKLTERHEETHQETIHRIHGINNQMQYFVDTQHEQAQFASQLEARIDEHDVRLDTNTASIVQMRHEIQAIRRFIGMPEPGEADALVG